MAIVICDLDSTLADTRARHEYSPVNNPEATWEDYHNMSLLDVPIEGTVRLLHLLRDSYTIHILTARTSSVRIKTSRWLRSNGIPFDVLRTMTPEDSQDPVLYKEAYISEMHELDLVALGIEDDPAICEVYEKYKIPALCVNPRYRADPMEFYESRG